MRQDYHNEINSNAHRGVKLPPFSDAHRARLRLSKLGENNPMWKGGPVESRRRLKLRDLKRTKELLHTREQTVGRKKPEECELCGSKGKICFDHDHMTGRFRGWICHKCNVVLGLVKDEPATLKKMITYLIKAK